MSNTEQRALILQQALAAINIYLHASGKVLPDDQRQVVVNTVYAAFVDRAVYQHQTINVHGKDEQFAVSQAMKGL